MSWDLHPWEGIRGKKDFTWAIPALKSSRLSHRLRPLVLGTSTGETASLAGWKTPRQTKGLWEAWIPFMGSLHMLAGPRGWTERGLF